MTILFEIAIDQAITEQESKTITCNDTQDHNVATLSERVAQQINPSFQGKLQINVVPPMAQIDIYLQLVAELQQFLSGQYGQAEVFGYVLNRETYDDLTSTFQSFSRHHDFELAVRSNEEQDVHFLGDGTYQIHRAGTQSDNALLILPIPQIGTINSLVPNQLVSNESKAFNHLLWLFNRAVYTVGTRIPRWPSSIPQAVVSLWEQYRGVAEREQDDSYIQQAMQEMLTTAVSYGYTFIYSHYRDDIIIVSAPSLHVVA